MSSRTGSAQRNPEGGRWSRWAGEREKEGAMVLEKKRKGERKNEPWFLLSWWLLKAFGLGTVSLVLDVREN